MSKNLRVAISVGFLLFSLSACTLARRIPLEIAPYNHQLSLNSFEDLHVVFEETLPNKPLNETVWDNASGPFWDAEESKQIGFTQDYSRFMPVAATMGLVGGAVGGAIVGATAGPQLVNTRIVVPFGNALSKTFEAIGKDFVNYSTCSIPNCGPRTAIKNVLKVKIDQFCVWEGPLNHLNFVVKGKSQYLKDGNLVREYAFEKSMLTQKLGTIMSTHASFLKEMNRIANTFAQELSADIMNRTLE